MSIRESLERREAETLSEFACLSSNTQGRVVPEAPDDLRPAFQRDRDRIIHTKAFRRLVGKTQVFLAPLGDHYRTRMTHTLEVTQVGRTIARALHLNEMLVEAVGMGHDLGHTPFGHAGERCLRKLIPGGFHHVRQSVRVVEKLAREGRGLNLNAEVVDGIAKHSKGKASLITENKATMAMTLEGQALRLADIIAYVNHDFDDAQRAGLMTSEDLPEEVHEVLGRTASERLETLITDVVAASQAVEMRRITMTPEVCHALETFRDSMYDKVYLNPVVVDGFERANKVLEFLWEHCMADPERFRSEYHTPTDLDEPHWRHVADFVTGMTDRYAIRFFEERFMPRVWSVM
jgi:dGTPase